ncbi:phosphoribosylanthranilate isomerase [Methanogenium organophilum]|uniref:N-(5'-phosphoribosyl)anthranilate isomerase n=1 Tax=Methanogenium organophilum TaxID=2199 RepID=A0A9X9S4U3_METOG|nr:phosphoribosylanthranilate isomerase [Methanogenium organophilum]WAI02039.1 phosphoribosylanthranilate isomerase [Methanogenium organophilum]
MRIKICGVTSPEDARCVEEAGADAVGVVLFSDSPRSVGPECAGEIFDALGPFTTGVCVTATNDAEEIDEMLALCPSVVQVGAEVSLPPTRARVLRMVAPGETPSQPCDAVVIDASRGKGLPFNREFARQVLETSSLPVILAGGLSTENVRTAVALGPYGLDVASGVEYRPGIKDPLLVRAFIRTCRRFT